MFRAAPCTRHRGFTAVELMVTLCVMVVLLTVAAPNLMAVVSRNQVASIKSSLATSMAMARSEAARSGLPVLVQAVAGGPVGNEFANGWNLYLDVDQSGTVSAGDTLLRHYEAPPPGVRLHGGATTLFSAGGYLNPAAALVFQICPASGSPTGYSLTVAPSGVTYVASIATC